MKNRILTVSLVAIAATAFGCASSGTAANPAATAGIKVNPDRISAAEIEALNARDAYEIVQRLRPNWISRGTAQSVNVGSSSSMGGTSAGGAYGQASARGGLVVYVDNAKMGWVEVLRDIPATHIASIQYMDAATATALLPGLGSDVITGAIVVHQRAGQ